MKIMDTGIKRELLQAFGVVGDYGMTNYEAGVACDYLSRENVPCYWKRVADLRVRWLHSYHWYSGSIQ